MKAIIALRTVGFAFTVQGSKSLRRWTRPDPPDPEKVAPLLAELRAKKLVREYLMMQPGHCEACAACGHWDEYGWWKMESFLFGLFQGQGCPAGADRRGAEGPRNNGLGRKRLATKRPGLRPDA
jgi:hypothetical protein